MPLDAARCRASWTTAPGSAPSSARTRSQPTRSAHVSSWSAAAARNVSPAASSTGVAVPTRAAATLPIVVVLPTPFTPTKSHTATRSGSTVARQRGGRGAEEREQLASQRPGDAVVAEGPGRGRDRDRLEDRGGRRGADVGAEQRLFDLGELVGADGRASAQGAHAVEERAGRAELGRERRRRRRASARGPRRRWRVTLDGGAGAASGARRRGAGGGAASRVRAAPGLDAAAAADPDEPDGRGREDHDGDRDDQPEDGVAHAGTEARSTFWLTTWDEPPGAMVTP